MHSSSIHGFSPPIFVTTPLGYCPLYLIHQLSKSRISFIYMLKRIGRVIFRRIKAWPIFFSLLLNKLQYSPIAWQALPRGFQVLEFHSTRSGRYRVWWTAPVSVSTPSQHFSLNLKPVNDRVITLKGRVTTLISKFAAGLVSTGWNPLLDNDYFLLIALLFRHIVTR